MDNYKLLKTFHFSKFINNTKKINNVLIFGNFGAMNIGDEAILAGQIEELGKIKKHVIVISRFPDKVAKVHKVSAISFYNFFLVAKMIFCSNLIIVGGGGIFCEVDTGIKGYIFQLYTLFVICIAKILSKDVFILGIGFYSNTPKIVTRLSRFIFNTANIVTVRDEQSYEILRKLGIRKVALYKDNSFLMSLSSGKSFTHSDTYFKERYKTNKVNIGISIKRPRIKREQKKLIHEIANFINVNSKIADFWIYSLDNNKGYETDTAYHNELLKQLKKTKANIYFVPNDMSPQDLFSSFALMDFMICMRLHASIFAYRLNIPFVGVSYDEKCTSFLRSVGKYPYDIQEVNSLVLQTEFLNSRKGVEYSIGN